MKKLNLKPWLFPLTLVFAVLMSACEDPQKPASEFMPLAHQLIAVNDFESAIPQLDSALQADESLALAWYLRGECYHSLDSFERALADYNQAIALTDTMAGWIRNRAICYFATDQMAPACSDVEMIFALDSATPLDYRFRSQCLLLAGQRDSAYNVLFAGVGLDSAGVFRDVLMRFLYDNFTEDYMQERYYADAGMTVEYTMVDGVKNGPWSSYSPTGELAEQGTYRDNLKEGVETTWYANGNKKSETVYKANRLDGLRRTWYDSGALWTEVNYRNDRRHGVAKAYHENGKLSLVENYEDGLREGRSQHFFLDGQVKEDMVYRQDQPEGEGIIWDPEEESYVKLIHESGVLLEKVVLPESEWP